MKKCSKCKEFKPLTEFRNDKYTSSGKTTRCKQCLSTYTPKEERCYYCQSWFTPKQSNWKFCTSKCHNRYWNLIFRRGPNGTLYNILYRQKYGKKDGKTCIGCSKTIDNRAKRCKRCNCIVMSIAAAKVNKIWKGNKKKS